ncbi:MAG: efflux RND transporter periplasmic adaptor subunit [Chitinophagaceae bacterium]|nr:efflux RND transporter periplasmic adaptor subunit [Chitinophagaceae bacterium]
MSKKIIWVIVALVAVLLILVGLKKGGVIGKEEGVEVTTEKVVTRTIIETVNASGKVYPEVEVKVSPDISGEIVELTVNEGDSVSRGQVLARIYADILSTQKDQASAIVSQQQAQVSNSVAQLGALRANLAQAEANYNRQKKLYEEKVISKLEYEQAEQAYKSAQANLNAAIEGINGLKAAVKSAEAQLNRANKDVSRTTIVAPMNGVVSLLAVKKGERVVGTAQMAGTEMMRIADMSSFEVRVDVGENDITKVKIGDTALVEVDAYNNRKFKGVVYKIANPQLNSATGVASSNEVTNYKVHIRLMPESYKDLISSKNRFPFRPGMTASADIQTKTKRDVVAVALNAVTTRDSKKESNSSEKSEGEKNDKAPAETSDKSSSDDIEEVVFVLQADATVKKVKVKTDIQDLNHIEILSGLKVGDEVIVGPYNVVSKTLKEGDKVKVVKKDKLFEQKKD